MLDLARKNDARVFYAFSSEAYGDPEVYPTPESYEGKLDPLGPRSCCEEGNRFEEALCKAYHDLCGLMLGLHDSSTDMDPGLEPRAFTEGSISRFITQALRGDDVTVFGDVSQTRSFCYATDTVIGSLLFMGLDRFLGHGSEYRCEGGEQDPRSC